MVARRAPGRQVACSKKDTRHKSALEREPLACAAVLRGALDLWGSRTARDLNEEDARQIVENATKFIQILREWDLAAPSLPTGDTRPGVFVEEDGGR